MQKKSSLFITSHTVIWEILHTKIRESEPAKEIPQTQLDFIHNYLIKVLGVENGLDATFEELALSIEKHQVVDFTKIITWIKALVQSDLFDGKGILTENRPPYFQSIREFS